MSFHVKCDRCGATELFNPQVTTSVTVPLGSTAMFASPTLPQGWERVSLKDSLSGIQRRTVVICGACDNSMRDWFKQGATKEKAS